MRYNFYFDICALAILLAMVGITLFRTWVPTYRNRMFMLLLSTVFVTTVAERIETILQMSGPDGSPSYYSREMTAGSVYFIFHLLSALVYLLYILSLLNIPVTFRTEAFRVFLPYIVGLVLVAANATTHILFDYDKDGLYHRGPYVWTIYILAAHYLVSGLLLLLRSGNAVRKRTKVVMTVYFCMTILGIVIQGLVPSLLVEEFVNSLSLALAYITVQSPSEMIDKDMGVLNRKAFLMGITANVATDSANSSIFICIDHIQSIGDQIGHAQLGRLLELIAAYLRRFGRYGFLYRYSQQMFVLALRGRDEALEDRIIDEISSRFREPWVFGDMQVRVVCCSFVIRRPEHYKKVDELMRMVGVLSSPQVHAGKERLDMGSVDIDRAMDRRRLLQRVRECLDSGSAQVQYRPIDTSGSRQTVAYDACLMLPGDGGAGDGEDIYPGLDMSGGEKGAILADANEYVLRKVCHFLRVCREAGEQNKLVSVRLSWSEISRPDFREQLLDILRIEGVKFSSIMFKLQETTLSNLGQKEEDAVGWLVSRGAAVVIEGFGMGYADIARLRRIHVSSIVLDHTLLESAQSSPEFKALVRGIIDMLHDIRITVMIDRIGSRREAVLAQELGSDYIEGDYVGEPLKEDIRLPITSVRED